MYGEPSAAQQAQLDELLDEMHMTPDEQAQMEAGLREAMEKAGQTLAPNPEADPSP